MRDVQRRRRDETLNPPKMQCQADTHSISNSLTLETAVTNAFTHTIIFPILTIPFHIWKCAWQILWNGGSLYSDELSAFQCRGKYHFLSHYCSCPTLLFVFSSVFRRTFHSLHIISQAQRKMPSMITFRAALWTSGFAAHMAYAYAQVNVPSPFMRFSAYYGLGDEPAEVPGEPESASW